MGYFGLMQGVQKRAQKIELLIEQKKNEKVLSIPQRPCFQGHVGLIMHKRFKRSKRGGKKLEILSTIWQDGQTNQEHILTMKMRMEEEPVEGCIDTSGVPPSSLDVKTFDELQKILGVTI